MIIISTALKELGISVCEDGIKTAKLSDMIVTKWGDWPVEIFLSSSMFSDEAKQTRQLVTLSDDKQINVLSAESICVFKVLLSVLTY